MLTTNFYNYVMTNMTGCPIPNGFTTYMGEKRNTYAFPSASPFANIGILKTVMDEDTFGVTIGTGTKAPAVEDFNLEAPLVSGFKVVNPGEGSMSCEEDCVKWTATYAITNTGAEPIRISEIGLFAEGYSGQSAAIRTLYDRTVLEEPIVIDPGHCKHITYTICFQYPVA